MLEVQQRGVKLEVRTRAVDNHEPDSKIRGVRSWPRAGEPLEDPWRQTMQPTSALPSDKDQSPHWGPAFGGPLELCL